jgi:DNA-directed RNA polymerase subunit RPC12/RpoP
MISLTQEVVMDVELVKAVEDDVESALTVCTNCGHLVPKTMLCLYCGHPIMFKMPKIKK